MGIYVEEFLEKLTARANVIIQTDSVSDSVNTVLGNHWAARWLHTIDTHFKRGVFRVKDIEWIASNEGYWVVTLDHRRDWITDKLGSESNCLIQGLDI